MIWRVVDATDSCASTYAAPVKVTRRGETRSCASPRFDMHELFELAHRLAREGPTAQTRAQPKDGQREIDKACVDSPSSCAGTDKKCPPFGGPWWPPATADGPGDGGAIVQLPSIDDAGAAGDAAPEGPKPSPAAVAAALAKVLPKAQACLRPGDPASMAYVTFRSDGAVENVVVVKIGVVGRDACIRAALIRTRVTAFPGGASYTVGTTIRPR